MLEVEVDGKALNEFVNYYEPLLVNTYEEGNTTWIEYESYKTISCNHRNGDHVNLLLMFSMVIKFDGTSYVRDVDHILISPVHEDDMYLVNDEIAFYNEKFIRELANGIVS